MMLVSASKADVLVKIKPEQLQLYEEDIGLGTRSRRNCYGLTEESKLFEDEKTYLTKRGWCRMPAVSWSNLLLALRRSSNNALAVWEKAQVFYSRTTLWVLLWEVGISAGFLDPSVPRFPVFGRL